MPPPKLNIVRGRHTDMTDTKNKTIQQIVADMKMRFTSGNKIPVERAHIRADEWSIVLQYINMAIAEESRRKSK